MIDSRPERLFWLGGAASALAGLAIFCLAPIAMLLIVAAEPSWPPPAYFRQLVTFTLWQALLSTLLSLALALPFALAMARRPRFAGRALVLFLLILPLGLPVLPAIFGLLEIWGRQGLVNEALSVLGLGQPISIYGLAGILLAQVFFNLPLAARLMLRELEAVPSDEWRLAASLGFSRLNLFRFVELPALFRALPGVAGLIFMLCVTSFTIVLTLGGGPRTATLEVAIYQALKFDYDPARAMLLSGAQLILTLVVFAILALLPNPARDRPRRSGLPFRPDARTSWARAIDTAIILSFTAFVGGPIVALAVAGLAANLTALLARPLFWQALVTSLGLALSAGLLATVIAFLTTRGRAMLLAGGQYKGFAGALRAPEFLLLAPPLALGSGWFMILLGQGMPDWAGYVMVALVNTTMALPFAVRAVEPALQAHLEQTGRLCASLGVGGLARFRIVDWPVLRGVLATSFSFAAALSLGDLGAIALFGSDRFVTLPSLLYASLGSYRSTDAAGLALLLAILCLFLMAPSLHFDRKERLSR